MGSSSSSEKKDNSWANPPQKGKAKPVKGIKLSTADQQKQLNRIKGMKKQIVSGKPIAFFGGTKHSDFFGDDLVKREDGLYEMKGKKNK